MDDPYFLFKLFALYLALSILIELVLVAFTRFERTITIDSKAPYSTGAGRSLDTRNLVADREGRVYGVRSAPLLLHFSAPEVFASLREGAAFRVAGYGVRVPLLGWYPNLIEAHAA